MELTDNAFVIFTNDIDYVVSRAKSANDRDLIDSVVSFLKDVKTRHNRDRRDFGNLLTLVNTLDNFPNDIAERLFHISTCVELRKGGAPVTYQGQVFYDDEYDELGDILSTAFAALIPV